CFYCGIKGHTQIDCRKRKRDLKTGQLKTSQKPTNPSAKYQANIPQEMLMQKPSSSSSDKDKSTIEVAVLDQSSGVQLEYDARAARELAFSPMNCIACEDEDEDFEEQLNSGEVDCS